MIIDKDLYIKIQLLKNTQKKKDKEGEFTWK